MPVRLDSIFSELSPKPRHVHLHRLHGTVRQPLTPQLVRQPVHGHRLVAMKEQHCQERALALSAE